MVGLIVRAIAQSLVFIALPVFLGAGTLAWTAGWVYVATFLLASLVWCVLLYQTDPGLLRERLKGMYQPGQPVWDKVFLTLVAAGWFALLVFIGCDAKRFHWSHMPVALQVVGFVLLLASFAATYAVMRFNSFAAPVVRVQDERGQHVITTGPYAIVRHPMYAGAMPMLFAIPLLLGSWWGLLGSVLLAGLIMLRIPMEEQVLRQGLAGYDTYASEVKYRLIPHVW
jgi:protein-S-isoprenylcysteine O-methyltransferase Ste14